MAASTRQPAFSQVIYYINTAGDTPFNPTIGTSDSPDYSADPDKSAAVAQCTLDNPQLVAVVASNGSQ